MYYVFSANIISLNNSIKVHPKLTTPEETHVMILADSISSSVHGANSPLKLGSNIFKHGSAELNLKL